MILSQFFTGSLFLLKTNSDSWYVSVLNWIVHNCFSIASLLIALYTLYKNRTILLVNWGNIMRTQDESVVVVDENNKYISAYKNIFYVSLTVVNPSPNDIAFFDLQAFDPKTKNFIEFLTPKPFYLDHKKISILYYFNKLTFNILNVPSEQYGVFKANSYTRFDLPVVITDPIEFEQLDTIGIFFRVAKGAGRKGAKEYVKYYRVDGWQDEKFKQPYNNEIKIFILASNILESTNLSQEKLHLMLTDLYETLESLGNISLTPNALETIVSVFKILSKNKNISDENKKILGNIKAMVEESNIWNKSKNYSNVVKTINKYYVLIRGYSVRT